MSGLDAYSPLADSTIPLPLAFEGRRIPTTRDDAPRRPEAALLTPPTDIYPLTDEERTIEESTRTT